MSEHPQDGAAAAASDVDGNANVVEKKNKGNKENAPPTIPEYIKRRIEIWDRLATSAAKDSEEQASKSEPITITLPDGKVLNGMSFKTTPYEIAKQLSNSLAENAILAKVNGATWDINRPFESNSALEIVTFDAPEGSHTFWHSSAHVVGQAIELLFEKARLCIGPPLEDGGFYYDCFLGDEHVKETDIARLEKIVDSIVKQKQKFERLSLRKEDALEMFSDNPFKVEIIQSKVPDGAVCTAYRCGPLIDLCRGPHVPHTGLIKAVSINKLSSAYWLGKADNPSLQRVYGISFPNKQRMKEWKDFMKMAEERDHRKVGLQQKLFFFHEWSPGSAFFLPHGTRIYNKLIDFIRQEYVKRGYKEVITPNVYNIELWKRSGHYENYADNMFLFECENAEFGVKPMNCPGHCLLFDQTQHSYRDLPLRIADFGVLHRNEISGALTGLTRVRRFQQDDAHIFCRQDQIAQEVIGVLDMLEAVYSVFGYEYDLALSTRPKKFLGEIEVWNNAEKALEGCLDEFMVKVNERKQRQCIESGKEWSDKMKQTWAINAEDGAFYGPKIDIRLTDALRRKHQCATIQLDFQMPIRFNLSYKDESSIMVKPVIIHRAILGSVERQIAVLIEHTGGKWPFWISPRQIILLPIAEKYSAYAHKLAQIFMDEGYYVDVNDSSSTLNKRVREAQLQQYNFILVVGENEETSDSVAVRKRDATVMQTMTIDEFKALCRQLTQSKAQHQ